METFPGFLKIKGQLVAPSNIARIEPMPWGALVILHDNRNNQDEGNTVLDLEESEAERLLAWGNEHLITI
jgi:hypothetical protein